MSHNNNVISDSFPTCKCKPAQAKICLLYIYNYKVRLIASMHGGGGGGGAIRINFHYEIIMMRVLMYNNYPNCTTTAVFTRKKEIIMQLKTKYCSYNKCGNKITSPPRLCEGKQNTCYLSWQVSLEDCTIC